MIAQTKFVSRLIHNHPFAQERERFSSEFYLIMQKIIVHALSGYIFAVELVHEYAYKILINFYTFKNNLRKKFYRKEIRRKLNYFIDE